MQTLPWFKTCCFYLTPSRKVLSSIWRVRVADLLRAGLRDSRQYPQAAQTESPLQTLEETVRTVLDQMLIKARSIETRVGVCQPHEPQVTSN
ncbi:hypothetical protein J6590_059478 [Homalodisca vitripennis]|nr:hypothetical protein J6590_059478 [Homalodisca vitripennis]